METLLHQSRWRTRVKSSPVNRIEPVYEYMTMKIYETDCIADPYISIRLLFSISFYGLSKTYIEIENTCHCCNWRLDMSIKCPLASNPRIKHLLYPVIAVHWTQDPISVSVISLKASDWTNLEKATTFARINKAEVLCCVCSSIVTFFSLFHRRACRVCQWLRASAVYIPGSLRFVYFR